MKDPELERLFSRISTLEAEYNSAKANTDIYRDDMNSEWQALRELQEQYRELKELADSEFNQASFCWEMGDRASAKEHSLEGKSLNEKKSYISSFLNSAHLKFDSAKQAFDQAKGHQMSVLDQLKEARAAKNRRLDELKRQNEIEAAHWHDKNCKRCGKIIRYRDDWSHVPNYCKDCKQLFDIEKKKWEKKPCRECGALIRYNVEWANPPNYCKDCKRIFEERRKHKGSREYKLRFNPSTGKNDFYFGTDNPRKNDGHGHVVVKEDKIRYVRDQYDPNIANDRYDAVILDDYDYS